MGGFGDFADSVQRSRMGSHQVGVHENSAKPWVPALSFSFEALSEPQGQRPSASQVLARLQHRLELARMNLRLVLFAHDDRCLDQDDYLAVLDEGALSAEEEAE